MKIAIRINAGNNASGNPRRGWVIYEGNGHLRAVDFVDEGYSGSAALDESGYRGISASSDPIIVSPKLYNEWRRTAKSQRKS